MAKINVNYSALSRLYNRNPNDINNVRKINRFKIRYANDELTNCKGYVFFVRPNLNIAPGGKLTYEARKCPELLQAYQDYGDVMEMLMTNSNISSPFINIITSMANNFSPQDAAIDVESIGETFIGYKMNYGKYTADSMNGGDLSIKFRDNRLLELYKLHHIWYHYIMHVRRGKISPSRSMVINKILDYQTCAYYFLVAEDGESIVYCAKYYGIFPKNIPSSAFSYEDGESTADKLIYDITYNWTFRDDYNYIHIFKDFNDTTGAFYRDTVPVFDKANYTAGTTWVNNAKIVMDVRSQTYKLQFTK